MQRDSEDETAQMPERMPSSPTARLAPPLRRRALARLGGVAATVVLLGVVLVLSGLPVPSLTSLLPPTPYHPPDGWQNYADPDSSFHVWIPPDWASQVSESVLQGMCTPNGGDCSTYDYTQESVLLGAAPQDLTSFAILISVNHITTDAGVKWWCRAQIHQPNTSIDGVPALRTQTSDGRPAWELFTRNAHFAIEPLAVHSPAEQQMTETLFAGFTPATTQPLPCSRS